MLPDDARARLRVEEEFAHFIDVLKLDILPPGDRGENRCRGEELKGVPVAINERREAGPGEVVICYCYLP